LFTWSSGRGIGSKRTWNANPEREELQGKKASGSHQALFRPFFFLGEFFLQLGGKTKGWSGSEAAKSRGDEAGDPHWAKKTANQNRGGASFQGILWVSRRPENRNPQKKLPRTARHPLGLKKKLGGQWGWGGGG